MSCPSVENLKLFLEKFYGKRSQIKELGVVASKQTVNLANLPTNVIHVHTVMSASVHSGKPGYFRIKIETQTSFDAFSITEDNRVLLFRYTSDSNLDSSRLSPVGLDQLADAFVKCDRDDLLPYTRNGAEWWIVWVVPEKIKDEFKPTDKFTTRVVKDKMVDAEQTKWENYVQHYVVGLDHNVDRPPEYEEFEW
jgi:hypothetical protein